MLAMNRINGAYDTDTARWRAVARRDKSADGAFFYSVRTTGIYCRPSCPAKLAHRGNVVFHATPADAERAGFRPCKRCRPTGDSVNRKHAEIVSRACGLIVNAQTPPSLDALADAVGMSAWHFHRIFKSQTGVTPKAYAAAHRIQRLRDGLPHARTVTSAIYTAGYNSNSRFYAESDKVLGMKPATFKTGGKGAMIRFAIGECSLGSILVAASERGVCSIAIGDDPGTLLKELQDRFPQADLVGGDESFERTIAAVIAFVEDPSIGLDLPLHIQGTAFQRRVWEALRGIPCGQTRTYSQIAERIGQPTASRAVAGACAANALAVAIPCHRVTRIDGSLSGYRWGVDRKASLLRAESRRKATTHPPPR